MFPVNGSLRTAPRFPRSGPGKSSSPMSQVLLRCYDFPPRISGHLFASLPGSTRSSSLRVSQLALPVGSEGTSGPGPLFNRRPKLPVHSHVDVSGTSQVPRRSILCLCPALRPRPNRRSLDSLTVSSMLPPRFPRQELQRLMNFGALSRGFGTCCLRFKTGVATTPARLASGWLARLYREGVEPSGSLQKVSDRSLILLFWTYPGAREVSLASSSFTSLDHLVGADEQRRRHFEAERVRPAKSCRPLEFLFLVADIPDANYFARCILDRVITGHVQLAEDVDFAIESLAFVDIH